MGFAQQSHKVQTAFWTALIGLMGSSSAYLLAHSKPDQLESLPRNIEQAKDVEAARERTTEPTEVRLRLLEQRYEQELTDGKDRDAVIEKRQCAAEQELRAEYARRVQLEGGKRGAALRQLFEDDTEGWLGCPLTLEKVEARRSLRKASDSVLLR